MAIAINGSGTITGISVGGIPDGTVDADALATNAVANAKVADDAIGLAELSATGTASSSTFLRGDNAWAAAGGGKLLQVVQAIKTDAEAIVTGFTWTDIGDLSVTITPSAATSKVFVMSDFACGSSNAYSMKVRLYRGSTHIYKGDDSDDYVSVTKRLQPYGASNDVYKLENVALGFLDSPNTTSATTYKLQAACYGSQTMYINRTSTMNAQKALGYDSIPASSITVMEIGA